MPLQWVWSRNKDNVTRRIDWHPSALNLLARVAVHLGFHSFYGHDIICAAASEAAIDVCSRHYASCKMVPRRWSIILFWRHSSCTLECIERCRNAFLLIALLIPQPPVSSPVCLASPAHDSPQWSSRPGHHSSLRPATEKKQSWTKPGAALSQRAHLPPADSSVAFGVQQGLSSPLAPRSRLVPAQCPSVTLLAPGRSCRTGLTLTCDFL